MVKLLNIESLISKKKSSLNQFQIYRLRCSMLTINADDHPVMGRFHKPGDEKRSLVIVSPERRDGWLHATPEHANRILLPLPAEEFTSYPVPIKPHKTA